MIPGRRPRSPSPNRLSNRWFLALIALQLLPIWSVRYLPTQDGPSHLANAAIIQRYAQPDQAALRGIYHIPFRPLPNWLYYLLTGALLPVVPPTVAEKLVLSLYGAGFPLAVRYALTAISPSAGWLAFLAVPFTFHYLFHMGFYGFCLGTALSFIAIGYWIRHQDRMDWISTAVLAGWLLLTYSAHLASCAAAGLTILLLHLGATPTFRRTLRLAAAGAPVAALSWWFLQAQAPNRLDIRLGPEPWRAVRRLHALISFNDVDQRLAMGVGLIFTVLLAMAGVSRWRRRAFNRWDAAGLVPVAFLALHAKMPNAYEWGGSFIGPRLSLYAWLSVLLWLSAQPLPRSTRWFGIAAASLATLGFTANHLAVYRRVAPYLAEYRSAAEAIRPGKTILPVSGSFVPKGLGSDVRYVTPFLHAADYLATEQDVVNLSNYEAGKPYFPVQFRPEINPFPRLGRIDQVRPDIRLAWYRQQTGVAIDYVLLWDIEHDNPAYGRALLDQLKQEGYTIIFVSSPRGLMRVYQLDRKRVS